MSLSRFPHYTDAALAKVVDAEGGMCESCEEHRTPIYVGPFYALEKIERICLNCIETGRAARRFSGSFNDVGTAWEIHSDFDREAGPVTPEAMTIVRECTPGYESWQDNVWLFHCGEGGVFHGDASDGDVVHASPDSRAHFERNFGVDWTEVMEGYAPGGSDGVYRFDCRKCGLSMFHWDCS